MQRIKPRIFFVYALFRPWDGSPCYVGKGHGKRLTHHEWKTHSNKHLANIFNKARHLKLEVPKVKIKQQLTEPEAFAIERIFIKAIGRKKHGGPLVNATDGGEGTTGHTVSKKVCKQRSQQMKALWLDPIWRANTIAHNTGNTYCLGRKLTKQHKAKIGKSTSSRPGTWLGKKFSRRHRANIAKAGLGRVVTKKTRSKISRAKKGIPFTLEHKKKLSLAKLGKKQKRAHRKNTSIAMTKFSRTKRGRALRRDASLARWAKVKGVQPK